MGYFKLNSEGFKHGTKEVWLQRRLIGVKSVEEGDRNSPLEVY